ncbi:MAG: cupredoxin domain-containing protein [Microbacterium sp.]|uniref:iron uptake system protein EfeO n=1 Tax=Microbacterium sp. TaxID=51671 RepID=UPI001AC52483|nr:iron uptake system protein EfeO [Microbacterium sp.]MBN9173120.1 cupredoxin domain-containing protein [Microbacterium sp.]
MTAPRTIGALAAVGIVALALTGCVAKSDVAASGALTVTSTDTSCDVSTGTAASGTLAFDVTNKGSQVTEFYLLAKDGLRIVGEVENIAPGTQRSLTVVAQPGDYFTLCKPGMVGEGVGRRAFTVSGEKVAASGADAAQKKQAVDLYASFVKDQVEQLLPRVKVFTAAYAAGDDAAARAQFPQVRSFYERIEPIAESLGDLDPKIDFRELDAVAEGIPWTGFHRIEKDLWVPARDAVNSDGSTPAWKDWSPSTPAERKTMGDGLEANVQQLYDYVHGADFTKALEGQGVAGLSNGAIGLLDEVAKSKITGEEDWWSGTDLYDFAANVEGSKLAFSLVKDFAVSQGASGKDLAARIDKGYTDLEAKLATYGSLEKGFPAYSTLSEADRRDLTNLINALAEPLSRLTSTILE